MYTDAKPAATGAERQLTAASPRGRWITKVGLGLASALLCLLVFPELYGWIVLETGGVLNRPASLHILANSCANLLVILSSWSARGRLDEKLGKSFSATLAAHGFLAMVVVLTHSFYSNRVMLSAAVISVLSGIVTVLIHHRLSRPRVAAVGPRKTLPQHLPAQAQWIEDPGADLRGFDLVLAGSPEELPLEWIRALSRAMLAGKPVRHCAEYVEETRGLVSIDHFDIDHLPEGGLTSYRAGKRVLDVALAVVAAPFALPIVACAALAILVSMGRPVFYVQPRVGLAGRPFNMVKLRTMSLADRRDGAEDRATALVDQRVTAVGRWLRRLRIDELPQLWHVIIGEMSFIGPRPEWTVLAERYSAQLPVYAYRHLVRPGLTGWAQVRSGYAGGLEETRTKVAYDLFYLKHLSFALDVQILLRTVWTVITAGGAR